MKRKKTAIILMVMVLVIGSTCVVNAKTVHGEYAGGTYEAMLMIEPMYVAEALSYQTESPSDALYTMVIGRVKDAEGNQWVFNAAGYGGCYAKSDGFYTYAFAEYSISDVTVEKLSVFR